MGQSQSVPECSKSRPCQTGSTESTRSRTADDQEIEFPSELLECREGELKVQRVAIYMEPLKSGIPFTHHFLIIDVDKVHTAEGEVGKLLLIKADKTQTDKIGRITVKFENLFRASKYEEKRSCSLEQCGPIPVQKLIDILKEPSSYYSALKENCWKYADQTFRKLIEEFLNRAEPGSETKDRLKTYLAGLPPLWLPADCLNWSRKEVAIGTAIPFTVAETYLGVIGGLAAAAAKTDMLLAPVLGLGDAPALVAFGAQPALALAAHQTISAAATMPMLAAWMHVGTPALTAAMNAVHMAGLAKEAGAVVLKIVFMATLGCPQVLGIAAGVVVGGCGIVFLCYGLYKALHGLRGGGTDSMTFVEFVKYFFWQCLICFPGIKMAAGCKWFLKKIAAGFKWLFKAIASLFTGSGSLDGHPTLTQQPDGQAESDGGTQPLIPKDGAN